ncbi:hypothetical protein [Tropicimonas aquimaris]|uniref:Uncharacterized protein n=1 Tax=Tropicimonas aquimaris TaxID=914152 RepID=A0ABW3IQL2_9RHOB
MGLADRLMKLERTRQASAVDAGSGVRAELGAKLARIAERTIGEDMTPAWCERQPPITIAAMCHHELGAAEHNFALWAKCKELSALSGVPGKTFRAMVDLRARGLRDVGLLPDDVFSMAEPEAVT